MCEHTILSPWNGNKIILASILQQPRGRRSGHSSRPWFSSVVAVGLRTQEITYQKLKWIRHRSNKTNRIFSQEPFVPNMNSALIYSSHNLHSSVSAVVMWTQTKISSIYFLSKPNLSCIEILKHVFPLIECKRVVNELKNLQQNVHIKCNFSRFQNNIALLFYE